MPPPCPPQNAMRAYRRTTDLCQLVSPHCKITTILDPGEHQPVVEGATLTGVTGLSARAPLNIGDT